MLGARNSSREFLVLLLAADMLFIVLYLVHLYIPYLNELTFDLSEDRGFSEVFQYVKEYWIIWILSWLALMKSEWSYLAWATLFGYLLIDDAFLLHENLGSFVVDYFGYQHAVWLRAQDYGELTVTIIAGLILLPLLASAYQWGSRDFKRILSNW